MEARLIDVREYPEFADGHIGVPSENGQQSTLAIRLCTTVADLRLVLGTHHLMKSPQTSN